MLNNHLGPVLALVLALLSTTAHAFIDLPYITPASPLAAQPITVNVRSGVCDAVLSEQVLSREGNAIHVVFFGVRYFNSELCTIPPGLTDFVLGTYPVGTYTLQVDLEYYGVTGILVAETIGNVPFRVDATPTSAVPAPINEPIAPRGKSLRSSNCLPTRRKGDASCCREATARRVSMTAVRR